MFGVPLYLQRGAVLAAAAALFYQSAVAVIAVELVLKDGDAVVLERAVDVGRQQVVGKVRPTTAAAKIKLTATKKSLHLLVGATLIKVPHKEFVKRLPPCWN
ncbi:hypothetical protein GCM10007907_30160 [Chitinimonas prasina]|uniref:Uncharacterized protein n=1 Tax=Chitinimonas prasina TaxID=1434937 RepID=A0ABQ5YGU6_9NEIS|nr:hypothetical protein GCM10007907_30160 [Chitinimonas prasina]